MRYVGVGRRLMAGIFDCVLVFFGLGFAIAALTGKISSGPDGVEFNLEGVQALALFTLCFVYFVAMEATLGATLGKMLFGVRVRTPEGGCISWTASLTRNLLRAVDVCFCFIGALLICRTCADCENSARRGHGEGWDSSEPSPIDRTPKSSKTRKADMRTFVAHIAIRFCSLAG